MYTIQDNTVVPIQCKDIINIGAIVDHRIERIENLVASHFKTSIHELHAGCRDTESKLMCCFMLHDVCHYSIGSLGAKYNVYHGFLRNKITGIYKKCLQDVDYMAQVTALRTAFLEGKTISRTCGHKID